MAEDSGDPHQVIGRFRWTEYADHALRFCREWDANAFIGAMVVLHQNLPVKDAMMEFAVVDQSRVAATEHVFI